MTDQDAGFRRAVAALNAVGRDLSGKAAERIITKITIQVMARTAIYTPVDTSNLINAMGRDAPVESGGFWKGAVHFRGVPYAKDTHEDGPRNWRKAGASDKYLTKGAAETRAQDTPKILKSEINRALKGATKK